jgi:hypothetical protein
VGLLITDHCAVRDRMVRARAVSSSHNKKAAPWGAVFSTMFHGGTSQKPHPEFSSGIIAADLLPLRFLYSSSDMRPFPNG